MLFFHIITIDELWGFHYDLTIKQCSEWKTPRSLAAVAVMMMIFFDHLDSHTNIQCHSILMQLDRTIQTFCT